MIVRKGFKSKEPIWRQLEEQKTPCFLFELSIIGEKIAAIKDAFGKTSFTQYYPIKTNASPDIIRYCIQNGLGLDTCSMGDLKMAELLDVPTEKISFTGVGISEDEMRFIHQKGIRPNLNSVGEIERWARLFPGTAIGVRVSPPLSSRPSPGDYAVKMGIIPNEWPRVKEIVSQEKLEIIKIHRHEHNGFQPVEQLLDSMELCFNSVPVWAWKYVEKIDFGGGWGYPYLREAYLDIRRLIDGIARIAAQTGKRTGNDGMKIEIEPGEFLVSDCGYILTRAADVKQRQYDGHPPIQVVILDTPFPPGSAFRKPEDLYPVIFKSAYNETPEGHFYSIVYGRTNSSMDVVNKGTFLPGIKTGQLGLIAGIGAYVPVIQSYFNEKDLLPEFIIIEGKMVQSKRAMTYESYLKNAYQVFSRGKEKT